MYYITDIMIIITITTGIMIIIMIFNPHFLIGLGRTFILVLTKSMLTVVNNKNAVEDANLSPIVLNTKDLLLFE